MDVRRVDPRSATWEIASPRYRVYFWTLQRSARVPSDSDGYTATEFELTGAASVQEVLEWVEASSAPAHSSYTVYVLADADEGVGLIRLAGLDPTQPSG